MAIENVPPPPDQLRRTETMDRHNHAPAYLLKRADQTINALYLEYCRSDRLSLTMPQLLYLCAVAANPGGHQAAAARLAGMDTPTAAFVVRALERKALVFRRESETDRRRKIIDVTEEGRSVRERGLLSFAAATRDFFAPAPTAERQVLQKILAKIAAPGTASPPALCDLNGRSSVASNFLPDDVVPGHLVGRCLQVAVALVTPALAPFDLTIRQYVVLTILALLGPCNLTRLTGAMGAERSTLAIVLPTLEGRELIRVRRGVDRSTEISLETAGRALLAQARDPAEAANDSIVAELTDAERSAFAATLGGILVHHGKLLQRD